MIESIKNIDFLSSVLVGIVSAIFAILIFTMFRRWFLDKVLPIAHNIAIIGFEKAGKTTLITTIFKEIFADKILGIKAIPKGQNSISIINENIATLERGNSLKPTTDQAMRSYTINMTKGSLLRKKTYKVQLADFPGKKSKKFADENIKSIINTEFFNWAIGADAFIFVIDLARYLDDPVSSREYVANLSKEIRIAWQHILNYHEDKKEKILHKPLIILFTKADLFHLSKKPTEDHKTIEEIKKKGFGEKIPDEIKLSKTTIDEAAKNAKNDFSDLINYLKKDQVKSKVLFVSSFGYINREKLNLSELINSILP
ncbi:GTPase domain-containing protein [candidate division KSB1 bacterium]|nr:GTPase domain-containing protein [candidate division KSB1 bacterium]MBL7095417.1 GTPase domain-containing protein [candidate division KSB1 bacterium]